MSKLKKKKTTTDQISPLEVDAVTSLKKIEESLVKNVLGGTLALHILRNSQKSASLLLEELLEIEIEVGRFVGEALQQRTKGSKKLKFQGVLANALSFIPFPSSHITTTKVKRKQLQSQTRRKKISQNKK